MPNKIISSINAIIDNQTLPSGLGFHGDFCKFIINIYIIY